MRLACRFLREVKEEDQKIELLRVSQAAQLTLCNLSG